MQRQPPWGEVHSPSRPPLPCNQPASQAIRQQQEGRTRDPGVYAQVLAAGQAQGQDLGRAARGVGVVAGPIVHQLLQLRQHLQSRRGSKYTGEVVQSGAGEAGAGQVCCEQLGDNSCSARPAPVGTGRRGRVGMLDWFAARSPSAPELSQHLQRSASSCGWRSGQALLSTALPPPRVDGEGSSAACTLRRCHWPAVVTPLPCKT